MDIMVAVEAIFQRVHEEFSAAAVSRGSGSTAGGGGGGGGASSSSSSTTSTTTSSSSSTSSSSKWIGVDADAKHRIDVRARTEVNTLRSILAKESAKLDETPGLRLRKEELDELFAKQAIEKEYYKKLLAILPEDPTTVTASSGEVEKYKADAQAIGWPGSKAAVVSASTSTSTTTSASMTN